MDLLRDQIDYRSSVAAVSCDRSTGAPMRECLLDNMILHSSDRIPE